MKKKYIIYVTCGLLVFFFLKKCVYHNVSLYGYEIVTYGELPQIIKDSLEIRYVEHSSVPILVDGEINHMSYVSYIPLCIDCNFSLKENRIGPWIGSMSLINNELGVEYKLKYNTTPPIVVYKGINLYIQDGYNYSYVDNNVVYRKYTL